MTAPAPVALRAGGKALHGVAYGVGGAISLSRAGVGATVEGVRERKAKHQQRREAALAQENDPFAITETHEEKTARMQQTAPPPAASLNGADTVYRSTTPEVHSEHAEAWAERPSVRCAAASLSPLEAAHRACCSVAPAPGARAAAQGPRRHCPLC